MSPESAMDSSSASAPDPAGSTLPASGMPDPANIITVAFEDMPGSENLEIGNQVYLTTPYGQQFPVKVVDKDKETITFDANHEMAGKELNFKIELLSAE